MFFYKHYTKGLAIISYMIGDPLTGECAVIDPVRDVDVYIDMAAENGFRITDILETHVHADFVSGSKELKHRLKGKPTIHCSGMGGEEWIPKYTDHVMMDAEEILLGRNLIKALHTPGHTPEHMCWLVYDLRRSDVVPWLIFSGDFLFVGSVGRPDLLGREAQKKLAKQLYHSIFETISPLADYLEIYPAHGAGSLCGKGIGSRQTSTLGFERQFNPALHKVSEEEWIIALMKDMPSSPPYFQRMKKINVEGPPILGYPLPGRNSLSPAEVQECINTGAVVVDIRPKEEFSSSHIPGSINIPIGLPVASWAGWMLPEEKPIVLLTASQDQVSEVTRELIRVGFDNILGYLNRGIVNWEHEGYPTDYIGLLHSNELDERFVKNKNDFFILDVRSPAEWYAGHIDGSHHLHTGVLQERFFEIPEDKEVVVVCRVGNRASMVASFLKQKGYPDVALLLGGVEAWKHTGKYLVHK